MDEELYGSLQYHSSGTSSSVCNYYCSYVSDQNMVVPPPLPPPLPSTPGFPVFGAPEQLVSGSMVSDAASMQKGGGDRDDEVSSAIIRARIASHPLYPKLVHAYVDCQKVGAPPEVACLLDEIRLENDPSKVSAVDTSCLGADPELDDFMETYCDMLVRYKSDLSRPFDEATFFLNDIEAQFHSLCNGSGATLVSDEAGGSSDEGVSGGGDAEVRDPSRPTEDRELKDKLLRKYSGYITTLKQEFSKKKKKGKLPREATQILLNWWNLHYKWPYPTESDKVALADLTGLDQKQINNWFINQRKRHWKPTENMQFPLVDSLGEPFFMNE